jgi:hypothetical protein
VISHFKEYNGILEMPTHSIYYLCFFNSPKCKCFNSDNLDLREAEDYWEEVLERDIHNPIRFIEEVCRQVTHRAVAGFIVEYNTGEKINPTEKASLQTQILKRIQQGEDVEDWLFREITQMKGDIYLILNLLSFYGLIRHTGCGFEDCDYPSEEEQGERMWTCVTHVK